MALGHGVGHLKAHIVAGILILVSGVAQTYQQPVHTTVLLIEKHNTPRTGRSIEKEGKRPKGAERPLCPWLASLFGIPVS